MRLQGWDHDTELVEEHCLGMHGGSRRSPGEDSGQAQPSVSCHRRSRTALPETRCVGTNTMPRRERDRRACGRHTGSHRRPSARTWRDAGQTGSHQDLRLRGRHDTRQPWRRPGGQPGETLLIAWIVFAIPPNDDLIVFRIKHR